MNCLRLKMALKVALLFMGCIKTGQAGVYQCVSEQGQVEFRGTPCKTRGEQKTFLPISYAKTNPKIVGIQGKAIRHQRKYLEKCDRKKARIHKMMARTQLKDKQKAQRRAVRCAGAQKKIEALEDQLRQGTKLKRYNRIQEKLKQAQLLKERYSARE